MQSCCFFSLMVTPSSYYFEEIQLSNDKNFVPTFDFLVLRWSYPVGTLNNSETVTTIAAENYVHVELYTGLKIITIHMYGGQDWQYIQLG